MTLSELVDSGILLGTGKKADVFVSSPEMESENQECNLLLDGIMKNRQRFEKVFQAKVLQIYPKQLWSHMILQIDVARYADDFEKVERAVLHDGRLD